MIDLSKKQTYKIINFILKNPEFKQIALHKKMHVSKGMISKTVKWLVQKQLVEKKASKYVLVNVSSLFSLFKLFRELKNNLVCTVSIKGDRDKLIEELKKHKVIFCTTTALQHYSSYYQDPSINFYSDNQELIKELKTELSGLTKINIYKPDLALEVDIEKKDKMLLTSKPRTIIDLFCNNQAYTAKELIEKTYGERLG